MNGGLVRSHFLADLRECRETSLRQAEAGHSPVITNAFGMKSS
jgi:hypothetical protein